MKKVLVVVDMQNDFITGSLANKEGQAIVSKVAEYIRNFDGDVIRWILTQKTILRLRKERNFPFRIA